MLKVEGIQQPFETLPNPYLHKYVFIESAYKSLLPFTFLNNCLPSLLMQRVLFSISRAIWRVSCVSVSVDWATDAHVINEALAAAPAEESLDHEVEPEDVQAQ